MPNRLKCPSAQFQEEIQYDMNCSLILLTNLALIN